MNWGSTGDVRRMYESYPYPSANVQGGVIYDVANLLSSLFSPEQLAGKSVLDAGCGSGPRIVGAALRHKQSRFLGLDMSAPSLDAARALARSKGADNVAFLEGDLLALDLDRRFDLIVSTGVVHHLEQPALGLRNLCRHLAPDGIISLWHYHPLGEHERLLQRELLMTLWGDDRTNLSEGVALMNALNLRLSSTQYGSTAAQRKAAPDQMSLDVDAYLHPIVNAYRFAEAIDLFAGSGMDWVAINGINLPGSSRLLDLSEQADPEEAALCVKADDLFSDPGLRVRYRALPPRARLAVIETSLRCTGFTILAGRERSDEVFGARVRGNVIRLSGRR